MRFADDPHGDRCPLGAHIRRANPRDGMREGPERSRKMSSLHQIIRRGRVYGPPTPAQWLPEGIGDVATGPMKPSTDGDRGLLFACLCGDIARQFEFIQQTWLNNPKHEDIFDETDPISPGDQIPANSHHFTIPRDPIRRRVENVTGWVTVRGAGYYLIPSRSALRAMLDEK